MDERRARIHDDLRDMVEGELRFEPLERAAFAHDASLYEIDPLGVIVPRTEADVVTVVKYAAENALPLHARGAGTGRAGESLGAGLVIDFSRYLRAIVAIGPESVIVQPGLVLDDLNARLAPLGRRLGPDPSGSEATTIGGMIGRDGSGPRSLRHGTMRDHVEALRVVFANGETADLGRAPWPAYDDEPADFQGVIVRKLGVLARRHPDLFAKAPPFEARAGYAFGRCASASGIDLARLLVGTEGTLALVTQATLRTLPVAPAQGVVLLPFGRISDAAEAVPDCLQEAPTACDLYDWRSLKLARDAVPACREWIAEAAESALIVEFEGASPDEVAGRIRALEAKIARNGRLASAPVAVHKRADCDRLMGLRRAIEPVLMRMKGRSRPVPLLEGIAVPPEALPEFLQRLQNVLKHHDVSWVFDARAGLGQVRARPFLDMADPKDVAKLEPLAAELLEAALDAGGGLAHGEHACGLARSQFLRRQAGERFPVFRAIKDAFDPLNVLNPGKIISDDPHLMTRDLKRIQPAEHSVESVPADVGPPSSATIILPILRWPDRSPIEMAETCNGCGTCRSLEPSARMCPAFRALRQEAASPRAQANLIRQTIVGTVDPKLWGTEEYQARANLCMHCKMCATECPSGVDVSSLMLEAKAAYVQNHGLPLKDWMLGRVEMWSRLASRLPLVCNALMASGPVRWLLDRLLGLSRLRRLPQAHRTPFVARAGRLGLAKPRPHAPGPRVVYFVDVYANYFDQELAESVVAVLHEAGVNVFVPAGQRGSGMPALVAGDVDHARDLALRNLRILGNAVRDGYTVVCSEPTAALMLRHEYLKLTDDLDAALVAEHTREVGQYLAGLDARGQWPRPSHPLRARVGYHQPCHLRALGVGTPGLDLIRTIPELDVEFIDRGCSGMAGTFGLARENFRTSLRAGRGLLSRLREPDIEIGATECGACRMQMEQGVTKRTLHPIKLLSLSYGLNPALRRQFKDPKPRHVLF